MSKHIVIFGATSKIAEYAARIFAKQNHTVHLVGRKGDTLLEIADDLTVRGAAQVYTYSLDLNHTHKYTQTLKHITKHNKIDIALIAFGTLPNQTECTTHMDKTADALITNGVSPVVLMQALPPYINAAGTIAVISSVAGDRGKSSNYTYGCAKAMVSTFASGLRQALYKKNIHVLDIRPGFVDTPMTVAFKKGALWAKPQTVAAQIVTAIHKRKNILYTPPIWWYIMLIFRNVPECIFKKLNL